MEVAKSLSIKHRLVDPDSEQRESLGIIDEEVIGLNITGKKSDEEISKSKSAARTARECYWLREIVDLNSWPTLMICGANHVQSFSEILHQQNISVKIAERDWCHT